MKIVPASCTYDRRLFLLAFFFSFIILTLPTVGLFTLDVLAVSLPEKIGRLNDYGNILTMEDQKNLKSKINQLTKREIGLTILISRRDPYSNPTIYASEIQRKWNLRKQATESLVVLVQEGDKWSIRLLLRPNLTNLFPPAGMDKFRSSLRKKVENGEIRSGVEYLISRIHEQAFPPEREEKDSKQGDSGHLILYLVLGIGGGVTAIVLLLWWEARRRCPRCGSRLTITRISTEVTGGEKEKYCPECGYHERG